MMGTRALLEARTKAATLGGELESLGDDEIDGEGFLVMINWERFEILGILREEELEKWEKLFNFAERTHATGIFKRENGRGLRY